ncbi:MAG: hypothetical protein II493_00510 [Spirochaetales bacterium]|nr:hypothetical protein [Spirochaetales bacterium]
MKKLIAVLLIALTAGLFTPLFSLTLDGYEPYRTEEFPKWSLNLRRAECIFFGGIPIAFPVTVLAYSFTDKQPTFLETLGVACAVSAVIAVVDYVLGVVNAD